jgi:hypothetical protein
MGILLSPKAGLRCAVLALLSVGAGVARADPPATVYPPGRTPAPPAATKGAPGEPGESRVPATNPADMLPLVDGSIRYLPPPADQGWKELMRTEDRLRASYATADGRGRIDINVTVEPRDIPASQAGAMARIIGKAIREDAKKAGRELPYPPRVEEDPRFFLVVHDRMKTADGQQVVDRKQLYRVMGLNLVHVAVVAYVPAEQAPPEAAAARADLPAAAPVLAAGEALLDGMRLTRGAAPVVFPRTQVRLTTPVDWKLTRQDQPNGPTATYTDPQDPNRQILVRSRILPKEAREDATKRDAVLQRMVAQERTLPPLKPGSPAPEEGGTGKGEYLKQVRTAASRGEQKLTVETRYLVVGDVLLSLRAVAPAGDETVGPIADALAASAQAVP